MEQETPQAPDDVKKRGSRFGDFHRRTYEMELLVSGAVVFGLFHLPPILEHTFASVQAGLSGDLYLVGTLAQTYFMLMVYGLIVAFVLHLVIRGFWIGLLGLESVFPAGIRWHKVKVGPFIAASYKKKIGSLARSVERVDNLCSMIFSFAFMVVFTFLYSIAVIAVGAVFALIWSLLAPRSEATPIVFWAIVGVVIGAPLVVGAFDKVFGKRLNPGGTAGRVMSFLAHAVWTFSPARLIGPTQLTLGTNVSNVVVATAMVATMWVLAAVQIGYMFVGAGLVRFDSLSYFPDSLREQGVYPIHYRSLRPDDTVSPRTPSIQSELVRDPYLKLFLPYYPRRHNSRLSEICSELGAISSEGLDTGRGKELDDTTVERAAACVGSLFDISLDGEKIVSPRFDFTVEPGTGLEGIITFIPIHELPAGRHELEIIAPPYSKARGSKDPEAEPIRHLLPFWV